MLCMLRQLRVPTGAERSGRFQTEGRYCGTGSATRVTSCVNPVRPPHQTRCDPMHANCVPVTTPLRNGGFSGITEIWGMSGELTIV